MKLLVTEAPGIGSVVASRLLAAGHEIVVFGNLTRGHREAVPEGAELVVVDLLDRDALTEAVADGFDGALHFAVLALVAESVSNPELYWRTNVGGTLNLLEAMVAGEVRRLVFSSTCVVHGQLDEVPIPETAPPGPSTHMARRSWRSTR